MGKSCSNDVTEVVDYKAARVGPPTEAATKLEKTTESILLEPWDLLKILQQPRKCLMKMDAGKFR